MRWNIQEYNGVPTIFQDGSPVSGLMYWTRKPSAEDTVIFRDAGIHLFSFMGNLYVKAPENTPEEELEIRDGGLPRMLMSPENIDKTMNMLIAADPQIKVLPRIVMNPPAWWEKEHPDELMRYYHSPSREYINGPMASLASQAWQDCWNKALSDTVKYFEEKWTDYVIGYHCGLGHCGEHTYWWWDRVSEFSSGQRSAFQSWLRKKYGSIGELNRIWHSEWKDFHSVNLPEPLRLAECGARTRAILLPELEADLIDFQIFSSDIMADTIIKEALTVKETLKELGREKLCGVFYGYINLVANSTQTTVGHSALTKVLDSPDIDFICGPLSYGARQNGGTVLPQMISGSISLRGKLFYNEDDTGTHLMTCSHHGYIPATASASVQAERRNFLETWRSGGSQWWMDLYGVGCFRDKSLQDEFSFLRQFAEKNFADRKSRAEIAVFVSLESALYMRDNPVPLTGNLIEQQLFEIASCGTSFDLFQDEDIPLLAEKGRLKQYRLCIFLNSLSVSEPLKKSIKENLQSEGRMLLWFYMPGYIRKNSREAKFAEELTGIKFHVVEEGIMPMLTETWLAGHRISYGLTRAVYPRFCACDPEAVSLGYYVNGTTIAGRENGDGVALAEKNFGSWKSIWSASPGLPSALITEMARNAGVHIFSERGDQIFFAGNWLGIHSKADGGLALSLPERFACRNLFSGENFPASDRLDLIMKRGETVLLSLSSEREFLLEGGEDKAEG